jgi:hypothetical protein
LLTTLITWSDVYFIPRLKSNIISLGQLDEIGCKYSAEDAVMTVLDICHTELVCLIIDGTHEGVLLVMHMRYIWADGHVNFRSLRSLVAKSMVKGMPMLEQVDQICDGCMLAKQRHLPFPDESKCRATRQLQLVHGDLCGPIRPEKPGGKRYFLLVVDDFSRFMWVVIGIDSLYSSGTKGHNM